MGGEQRLPTAASSNVGSGQCHGGHMPPGSPPMRCLCLKFNCCAGPFAANKGNLYHVYGRITTVFVLLLLYHVFVLYVKTNIYLRVPTLIFTLELYFMP